MQDKTVVIGLRMKPEEKERIAACAKAKNLKPSTWAKAVVMNECDKIEKEIKKGK